MTSAIKHRGPDDEGYLAITLTPPATHTLVGKDSQVPGQPIETFKQTADFFLGHRRLSILDPTPAGHQPMNDANRDTWIVYNGEIYNFIEVRAALRRMGHEFRTNTDTEVLLAAYRQWGESCLEQFDGMWAFVIYDGKKNRLFGARDRFGVKPLYYYRDSSHFAFASEIKALLTLPFIDRIVNREKVFDYLAFSGPDFVEESFFKGIYELQPSHAFTYDLASGELKKWKYYTLKVEERWESFNEKKSRDHIHRVRDLIIAAIRLRLRSDVPLGSALSGGIDSSALVCVINRLIAGETYTSVGNRQKVFTAGFPGTNIDESSWAQQVARQTGAEWFVTQPTPEEFLKDIEDVAYYQDTPYGSPSVYAQYRVMRLAHENNVKVLLDGQGADELFTGYTTYYPVFYYQLLKHMNIPSFLRELKHNANAPLESKILLKDLFKQFRRNLIPYRLILSHRMKQKNHTRFIQKDFWEQYKERFDLIKARDFNSLNSILFEYFTRQKLGNLLKYEDRNSMRYSIESRTPFSDSLELIEYVFSIPAVYKIHHGWSKYLLREAMKDILPEEIRLRTDKKGFFIPDLEWLGHLKNNFHENLGNDLEQYADIPSVRARLAHGFTESGHETIQMIWRIVSLGVWLRVFSGQIDMNPGTPGLPGAPGGVA